jgi:hypothetical protein
VRKPILIWDEILFFAQRNTLLLKSNENPFKNHKKNAIKRKIFSLNMSADVSVFLAQSMGIVFSLAALSIFLLS